MSVAFQVRTTGLGSSSFMARLGGMACGWVGLLTTVNPILPFFVFGLTAMTAGLVALKLPETAAKKGEVKTLPDTIEDGEKVGLTPLFECCE